MEIEGRRNPAFFVREPGSAKKQVAVRFSNEDIHCLPMSCGYFSIACNAYTKIENSGVEKVSERMINYRTYNLSTIQMFVFSVDMCEIV